jgi:hypothetical protein
MPSVSSMRQLFGSVVTKKETAKECIVDGSQVHTFDEVTFKAPITKCYTVLAKDCSSNKPKFAVLMKKSNGNDKILKVVKDGDMIEIEPTGNGFRFRVNEEDKEMSEMEEYGFSVDKDTVTFTNSDLTVRFNGRKAWIKLSQFHKNTQCGICGHYDEDEETEFVKGNNEVTSDLREYHKSYTLKDGQCDADFEETIQRERLETIRSEEFFDEESDETDNDDPIEKTRVIEFGHKICFSMKPAAECPKNRYPTETKKEIKAQFACLPRSDVQARQILRKTRTQRVVDEVSELAPSFVETIRIPIKCEQY